MSNQLQITGGAKVRNLEGVITGTTGVLSSLPINASNGIPQLDVNGKILVSQLPNSVMEYQGTWNATTNTPYLVNGVGNAGDVYLVSTGGVHDFGAGAITFVVSDQVIYSGSIWQKASGSNGTVTSVAVTESGDALSITGSPITTSGTINIGFAGSSAQYVAGNGSLITFPTLTGYVPYTGATADVNLGAFDLYTSKVWLYDNPNSGYGSMELTDGVLHFEDVDGHSMVTMEDGYLTIANASTIRALLNVSGLTANRDYAFPNASGTLALTSDLSGYVPTSRTISTTSPLSGGGALSSNLTLSISQANTSTNGYLSSTDWNTFNNKQSALTFSSPLVNTSGTISIPVATTSVNGYLSSTDWNTFNNKQNALGFTPIGGSGSINYISKFTGSTTISQSGIYEGVTNYVSIGNTNTTYNLDVTGTARVTGDVIFGNAFTLTGSSFMDSMTHIKQVSVMYPSAGYTTIAGSSTGLTLNLGGAYNLGLIFPTAASYNYTYPAASGTLALTSQLNSGTVTSVGLSSATSGVTIGSSPITTSGTITIAIATASGSQNGLLSSTDWTTFNGKQNALTNPVTGTGTSGYVTYFNGTSSVAGSANHFWDNTNNRLGIGTSSPSYTLDVNGIGRNNGSIFTANSTLLNTDATISLHTNNYLYVTGNTSGGLWLTGGSSRNNNIALRDASNLITFDTAGSERMRITSGGYLGIGTSSPKTLLDVYYNGDIWHTFIGGGTSKLLIGGQAGSGGVVLQAGAASTANNAAPTTTYNMYLQRDGGYIGIGLSNPQTQLHMNGVLTLTESGYDTVRKHTISHGHSDGSSTNNYIALNISDGSGTTAERMRVNGLGAAYQGNNSTVWSIISDIRIKDNIRNINNSLEKLLSLNPVHFEYKNNIGKIKTGFIAQEFEKVFPGHISEQEIPDDFKKFVNSDTIKSIDTDLIPYLVKAIQELEARLKTLENK